MIEGYRRGKQANISIEHILIGHETKTHEKAIILKDLGVDELCRIVEEEYPNEANVGDLLWHVNLPLEHSRNNFTCTLSRIIKRGYFNPPEEEVLPILSYQNIWIASVEKFFHEVNFEELPEHLFDYPIIGGAGNAEELRELLLRRYGQSLPSLDSEALLVDGFALTLFKLERVVSWPSSGQN